MTLTADGKRRVVLPGAASGDVFACEKKGQIPAVELIEPTTAP